MAAFQEAYKSLNQAQKQAVDQIDGPVLVIAGPGTGKTQLLSARVANILQRTDTLPQNILCLTFTESGAANMRERLTRFIGQAAYDVNIGTYHAFGGELITRYPEYFGETRLQSPVDDLGRRQIIETIVGAMEYTNPLKSTQYHLHDLLSTIGEVKRGLLDEHDLRAIAAENTLFVAAASEQATAVFGSMARLPSGFAKAAPLFEDLLQRLTSLVPDTTAHSKYGPLAVVAVKSLNQALQEAEQDNSSKPLTGWKNDWLEKNAANEFIFKGARENSRIEALADVFVQYQAALAERGLYDFDDMILRSIQALQKHDELRYSLQEKYLYLLLDEFQDTNAAQLSLVRQLTDNPLNEGRPNVMAVGDDDQAIYAFQGAEYSNMEDFARHYRDTFVVNLTENYRSHGDILHVAHNIAGQIGARLSHRIEGIDKVLSTGRDWPVPAHIVRTEYLSDIGQYEGIADSIANLVKQGAKPAEIAVLAPKHKQLEPLVPFLNKHGIAVRYEKRENILETTVVRQLLVMSRLVLALQAGDETTADTLWPEVLSYEFWQLSTADIWNVSWAVRQAHPRPTWAQVLLATPAFKTPALLMLNLANRAEGSSLELMLDYLIGNEGIATGDPDLPLVTSPLKAYFTDPATRNEHPETFYDTLSHLTVLRAKLRDFQQASDGVLGLADLLRFVGMYEAAGERMMNTNPYNQQADAVQLMTVFKAKGLEFDHVFLPSLHDDVWGDSSRGQSNRLTLPANLAPIRYAGASPDERLRIFFVAITRARLGLYMTNYRATFAGKATKRLKYLNEQDTGAGWATHILPEHAQTVTSDERESVSVQALQDNWRQRHLQGLAEQQLRELLQHRLDDFRLSASQLGSFTDMVHAGPETFFLESLLRFPGASSPAAAYGTAIHASLQFLQQQINAGTSVSLQDVQQSFSEHLAKQKLNPQEHELRLLQGRRALSAYIAARRETFVAGNRPEVDLWPDNITLPGGVRLSGKLDRLDLDPKARTVTIIDYKTGAPFTRWSASDDKSHRYRQQLYFYKLLIEHASSWQGWTVIGGRLEFIEPDADGMIQTLSLQYDDTEADELYQLVRAVWNRVMALDMPDTSGFDVSVKGTLTFERMLRESLEQ